jgi:hypothetical protein
MAVTHHIGQAVATPSVEDYLAPYDRVVEDNQYTYAECMELIFTMPHAHVTDEDIEQYTQKVHDALYKRSPGGPPETRPVGLVVCTRSEVGLEVYAGGKVLAILAAMIRRARSKRDPKWEHALWYEVPLRVVVTEDDPGAESFVSQLPLAGRRGGDRILWAVA